MRQFNQPLYKNYFSMLHVDIFPFQMFQLIRLHSSPSPHRSCSNNFHHTHPRGMHHNWSSVMLLPLQSPTVQMEGKVHWSMSSLPGHIFHSLIDKILHRLRQHYPRMMKQLLLHRNVSVLFYPLMKPASNYSFECHANRHHLYPKKMEVKKNQFGS